MSTPALVAVPPVVQHPPARPAAVVRGPSPQTLQRRREVLAGLAATTVVTGLLGLLAGGLAWLLFVLAYVALSGYVALLVQLRTRRDEARQKLHVLTPPAPVRPLSSGVRIRTARGA